MRVMSILDGIQTIKERVKVVMVPALGPEMPGSEFQQVVLEQAPGKSLWLSSLESRGGGFYACR
jgi:hypothetical protein